MARQYTNAKGQRVPVKGARSDMCLKCREPRDSKKHHGFFFGHRFILTRVW